MDLTLQKSVELGVQRIVPLVTAHTQVRLSGDRLERRQQHWEGVIIAACEQCGRAQVPELLPMIALDDWLDQSGPETGEALRLVLDHRAARRLGELAPPAAGVTLLIGPEGGLEETEITAAQRRAGYQPLALGPRVLRTETAGLATLAALQTLWGDMG
jgi:16S rRNA (uracil1498-N3)-methyltransferase